MEARGGNTGPISLNLLTVWHKRHSLAKFFMDASGAAGTRSAAKQKVGGGGSCDKQIFFSF